MKARIGRLWRLARGRTGVAITDVSSAPAEAPATVPPDGQAALPPEQPVLLLPSGPRTVRVGELLPAPGRRWPLSLVRLPVVPKRAILAAGICAGLAAPTVARHLATRVLLGSQPVASPDGVLEITRIVYTGPLTPRATAAIVKAILATRR